MTPEIEKKIEEHHQKQIEVLNAQLAQIRLSTISTVIWVICNIIVAFVVSLIYSSL